MSDIDKILNDLTSDDEPEEENKKDLVKKKEDQLPDATETDELMQEVVKMTIDDRKKADDLYNVFLPEVAQGRDRSSASKEAMSKAVELKISAAKNIIDLLKLKKEQNQSTQVGVFLGEGMSQKKAGIDLKNVFDAADD